VTQLSIEAGRRRRGGAEGGRRIAAPL